MAYKQEVSQSYSKQLQEYKRQEFNTFLDEYATFTAHGVLAGLVIGAAMKRPHTLIPLSAGIAGGIAIDRAAERFNQIQQVDKKIQNYLDKGDVEGDNEEMR